LPVFHHSRQPKVLKREIEEETIIISRWLRIRLVYIRDFFTTEVNEFFHGVKKEAFAQCIAVVKVHDKRQFRRPCPVYLRENPLSNSVVKLTIMVFQQNKLAATMHPN